MCGGRPARNRVYCPEHVGIWRTIAAPKRHATRVSARIRAFRALDRDELLRRFWAATGIADHLRPWQRRALDAELARRKAEARLWWQAVQAVGAERRLNYPAHVV